MSGDPLRQQFVRAFQRAYNSHEAPTVGTQVVPVSIIDVESFPTARRFVASGGLVGTVANYSYFGLKNIDPVESGSAIIIDWFRVVMGAAADLLVCAGEDFASPVLLGNFTVPDIAPMPSSVIGQDAKLSNVLQGTANDPALYWGATWWMGALTSYESPPQMPKYVVAPQTQFVIGLKTLNVALNVTIGGRYYGST